MCYLELQALGEYLSENRVQVALKFWQADHYTWIYKQVELHHDLLSKIISESGLILAK